MRFAVIGGDTRQIYLGEYLREQGHETSLFGFDLREDVRNAPELKSGMDSALAGADCVLLPYPCESGKLKVNAPFSETEITFGQLFSLVYGRGIPVFAGKVGGEVRACAEEKGIVVRDYAEREDFIIKNAIPSAEGALQVAMEETKRTVHGSVCLVAGYGRIGTLLSSMLHALGARVYVSARKAADLEWIKTRGLLPMKTDSLEPCLPELDIIFNTVPAMVFTENRLAMLKKSCVIIDVASMPGGVDFAAARRLSRKTIHALSLPGKVAPESAGQAIGQTVISMMEELA